MTINDFTPLTDWAHNKFICFQTFNGCTQGGFLKHQIFIVSSKNLSLWQQKKIAYFEWGYNKCKHFLNQLFTSPCIFNFFYNLGFWAHFLKVQRVFVPGKPYQNVKTYDYISIFTYILKKSTQMLASKHRQISGFWSSAIFVKQKPETCLCLHAT